MRRGPHRADGLRATWENMTLVLSHSVRLCTPPPANPPGARAGASKACYTGPVWAVHGERKPRPGLGPCSRPSWASPKEPDPSWVRGTITAAHSLSSHASHVASHAECPSVCLASTPDPARASPVSWLDNYASRASLTPSPAWGVTSRPVGRLGTGADVPCTTSPPRALLIPKLHML